MGGSSAGRPQPGELVGHSCLAGSHFGLGHFYSKEGESRDRLLEMAKVSCPFVLPHCFGLAFGQGRWLGAAERGALNVV